MSEALDTVNAEVQSLGQVDSEPIGKASPAFKDRRDDTEHLFPAV